MVADATKVQVIVQKEWDQTLHAASLYRQEIDQAKAKVPVGLQTALADSFAVHMRNLVEFLAGAQHGDDPRAVEFFSTSSSKAVWLTKCSTEPFLRLLKARKDASQQLSHITIERTQKEETTVKWKPQAIVDDLAEALQFLMVATENESTPFWQNHKELRTPSVAIDASTT